MSEHAAEYDSTCSSYTVAQIREAFTKHASDDDWGVPSFYEGGVIAALRGEYDGAPATSEEWGVVVDDLGSTDMAESEAEAREWLAAGQGQSLVRVVVTEWPSEVRDA